jgi:hypothetical protein
LRLEPIYQFLSNNAPAPVFAFRPSCHSTQFFAMLNSMDGKELAAVRLDFDGALWITSDSVRQYLGVQTPPDLWVKRIVEKFKFRSKTDWLRKPQFLFSPAAADKIISNTARLDEFGLPVLPPEKPKCGEKTLINPFKF